MCLEGEWITLSVKKQSFLNDVEKLLPVSFFLSWGQTDFIFHVSDSYCSRSLPSDCLSLLVPITGDSDAILSCMEKMNKKCFPKKLAGCSAICWLLVQKDFPTMQSMLPGLAALLWVVNWHFKVWMLELPFKTQFSNKTKCKSKFGYTRCIFTCKTENLHKQTKKFLFVVCESWILYLHDIMSPDKLLKKPTSRFSFR